MYLPIFKGPLRGTLWATNSRGKIPRILLGSYEREQTQSFVDRIRPGDTVLDIGSHAGYYTALSSRLVGSKGKVVAFEPDGQNANFLHAHIRINRFRNVTAVDKAVGKSRGTVRFTTGTGSGTGHICEEGAVEVPLCTVDDVVAEMDLQPTHMKIDVEGAEMDVLEGAHQTLCQWRPVIYLSTHGPDVHAACCQHLAEQGYTLTPLLGDELATTTEVLCVPNCQAQRSAA